VVSYLLETRVSGGDSQDGEGWTALHHAAFNGHAKCIEILLTAGCDPATKNKREDTPLHIAISKGTTHIAKLLLDHTPSLAYLANKQGLCPLQIAVIHKQFECLDILYKYHKPTDPLLCGDKENILHTAAKFGCIEAFPLLVHLGNDPRELTQAGFTIFHSAAAANQAAFLESLLSGSNAGKVSGLDPNSVDKLGRTPLHVATIARAGKCVQTLLNFRVCGARVDEVDDDGASPLLYALTPYLVKEELGKGGEEGGEGRVVPPDLRSVFLLLKKEGISLLHRNYEGDTVLHLAVHTAFCLLQNKTPYRPSPSSSSFSSTSNLSSLPPTSPTHRALPAPPSRPLPPRGFASKSPNRPQRPNNSKIDLIKLFKMLLEHSDSEANAVNASGQTPLHILAELSQDEHVWARGTELVDLIVASCDKTMKDLKDRTPEEVAGEVGGGWLVQKLRA